MTLSRRKTLLSLKAVLPPPMTLLPPMIHQFLPFTHHFLYYLLYSLYYFNNFLSSFLFLTFLFLFSNFNLFLISFVIFSSQNRSMSPPPPPPGYFPICHRQVTQSWSNQAKCQRSKLFNKQTTCTVLPRQYIKTRKHTGSLYKTAIWETTWCTSKCCWK
jgi:hypothetical protein